MKSSVSRTFRVTSAKRVSGIMRKRPIGAAIADHANIMAANTADAESTNPSSACDTYCSRKVTSAKPSASPRLTTGLRAVTSVDGMTADYYPFTHEFLGETMTRIINEVQGVNRVFYDVTSKPPGTIELE